MAQKSKDISVACPCCGARLTIDTILGKIIAHQAPPKDTSAFPDLGRARDLLSEQAARREELFRQSTENERIKSELLERKFAAALEKSKDEPVEKPTRDIDLE